MSPAESLSPHHAWDLYVQMGNLDSSLGLYLIAQQNRDA